MSDTTTVLVRGIDAALYRRLRERTWQGDPSANDVLMAAVNRGIGEWLRGQERKERTMGYTISDEKLRCVAELAGVSVERAGGICNYDWAEGQAHQEWLDTAPAQDIADWLRPIIRDEDAEARVVAAEQADMDGNTN